MDNRTGEVVSSGGSGWYGDYIYIPYSDLSWLKRGAYFQNSQYGIVGIFSASVVDGEQDSFNSTRAILVSLN